MNDSRTKESRIWGGVFTLLYATILGALGLWGSCSVTAPKEPSEIIVDLSQEEQIGIDSEKTKNIEEPSQPEPAAPKGRPEQPKSEEPTPKEQPEERPSNEPAIVDDNAEEVAPVEDQDKIEEEQAEEEPKERPEEQPVINERGLFKRVDNTTKETTEGTPSQTNTPSGEEGDPEWQLAGRTLVGTMPRPSYENSDASGMIVIDITVDHNGKVISAMVGKGSTTSDAVLVQEALKAARKVKFSPSDKDFQDGTITYYFVRKVR